MARLLSSIPLVRHGFPPVCISPLWRGAYYESMNTVRARHPSLNFGGVVDTRAICYRAQAWEGDYLPLMNCVVESIKASLTDVERIMV